MRNLPLKTRINGFNYTQVQRGERSCIYKQEVTPEIAYFEVWMIRVKGKKELFEKIVPEREVIPRNEDFGRYAWTYRRIEKAIEKFNTVNEE